MLHKYKLRALALLLAVLCCVVAAAPRAEAAGQALAVERQVYAFLTEKMGLNTAAACGILANIEHESAFQPTVVGDQGTSFGLCQWHNERWTALRSYCSLMGLDWRSVEGQMEYLRYELGNNYTSLLVTLKTLGNTPEDAYQAAYLWCTRFERPSNAQAKAAQRGSLARGKYWNRYNRPQVEMAPEPETEPLDPDSLSSQLIQQPVVIPLPPEEDPPESDRRYHAEKLPLITYIPRHLPRQEEPEESAPGWEIPMLVGLGIAAAAVVLWPEKPRKKKRGRFEKV